MRIEIQGPNGGFLKGIAVGEGAPFVEIALEEEVGGAVGAGEGDTVGVVGDVDDPVFYTLERFGVLVLVAEEGVLFHYSVPHVFAGFEAVPVV